MSTFSLDDIDSDFYVTYGRAMAGWAELERNIGSIMRRITGMESDIATALYYSANSFAGRVQMAQAVIPFAKTIPAGKEFLTRATRIASNYAQARNRLAHDPHTLNLDFADPEVRKVSRRIGSLKGAPPVEIDHIRHASLNFAVLAMMIGVSFGDRKLLRDPELSLSLLDLAPVDPLVQAIDLPRANLILQQLAHQPD